MWMGHFQINVCLASNLAGVWSTQLLASFHYEYLAVSSTATYINN